MGQRHRTPTCTHPSLPFPLPSASFLLVPNQPVGFPSQDCAWLCTALGSQVGSLGTVVSCSIRWASHVCLHVGQSLQPWRRQSRGNGRGPTRLTVYTESSLVVLISVSTHCWARSWYLCKHKNLVLCLLLYNPSQVPEVGH